MKIRTMHEVVTATRFPDIDDADLAKIDPAKLAKAANHFASDYSKDDSPFREIIQNGLEAHMDLGIDKPVRVTLPASGLGDNFHDGDNNVLSISDFAGLTEETARTLLFSPMASTKDEDDDHAGGFGIGALSPLYIAPSFFVTTALNGVLVRFEVVHSPRGIAHPVIMRADWKAQEAYLVQPDKTSLTVPLSDVVGLDWDGSNGTTVDIPIPAERISVVRSECVRRLRFYTADQVELAGGAEDAEAALGTLAPGAGLSYGRIELFPNEHEPSYWSASSSDTQWNAMVKGIAYPLAEYPMDLPTNVCATVYLHPDEVTIAKSRESLTALPNTTAAISNALREAGDKVAEHLRSLLDTVMDEVEGGAALNETVEYETLLALDARSNYRAEESVYFASSLLTDQRVPSIRSMIFRRSMRVEDAVCSYDNDSHPGKRSVGVYNSSRNDPTVEIIPVSGVDTGDDEAVIEVMRAFATSVPKADSKGAEDASDGGWDGTPRKRHVMYMFVNKDEFDNQKATVRMTVTGRRGDSPRFTNVTDLSGPQIDQYDDLKVNLADLVSLGQATVCDSVDHDAYLVEMAELRKIKSRQARIRSAANNPTTGGSTAGGPTYKVLVFDGTESDEPDIIDRATHLTVPVGKIASVITADSVMIVVDDFAYGALASIRRMLDTLTIHYGYKLDEALAARPIVVIALGEKSKETLIKRTSKVGAEFLPTFRAAAHYVMGKGTTAQEVARVSTALAMANYADTAQNLGGYVTVGDEYALTKTETDLWEIFRGDTHHYARNSDVIRQEIQDRLLAGVGLRREWYGASASEKIETTFAKMVEAGVIDKDFTEVVTEILD